MQRSHYYESEKNELNRSKSCTFGTFILMHLKVMEYMGIKAKQKMKRIKKNHTKYWFSSSVMYAHFKFHFHFTIWTAFAFASAVLFWRSHTFFLLWLLLLLFLFYLTFDVWTAKAVIIGWWLVLFFILYSIDVHFRRSKDTRKKRVCNHANMQNKRWAANRWLLSLKKKKQKNIIISLWISFQFLVCEL